MFWQIFLGLLVCYFYLALCLGPLLALLIISFWNPSVASDTMVAKAKQYERKAQAAFNASDWIKYNNYAQLAANIREDIPKLNWFNCGGYLKKHGLSN